MFVEGLIKKDLQIMSIENKNNKRTVYHVTPDAAAERWVVSQENGDVRREFDRKEEAIEFAKKKAQFDRLSQVKVHRKDGNVDYESTYGEDPRDIPGWEG